MSYSFTARGATKAAVKAAAAAEFDKVVESQPVHAVDRGAALAAVEAFVDQLVDPADGQEVRAYVSGSLGWRAEGEFTTANVTVGASVATAE